jgi:hypothetical protein
MEENVFSQNSEIEQKMYEMTSDAEMEFFMNEDESLEAWMVRELDRVEAMFRDQDPRPSTSKRKGDEYGKK